MRIIPQGTASGRLHPHFKSRIRVRRQRQPAPGPVSEVRPVSTLGAGLLRQRTNPGGHLNRLSLTATDQFASQPEPRPRARKAAGTVLPIGLLLLLFLLEGFSLQAQWGPAPVLATPIPYTVAGVPRRMMTEDLNQDGITDVVLLDFFGYTQAPVGVLLGSEQLPQSGPTVPGMVTAISGALADMNRDGKFDLVASSRDSLDFRIYLGNGDGSFQSPAIYPSGGVQARGIAVADFDGNGTLDVAVAQEAGVRIVYFNSAGGVQSNRDFEGLGTTYELLAADFDQDGAPDLAVIGNANPSVLIIVTRLRSADPHRELLHNPARPFGQILAATVGDFLGNGKPSLVLTDTTKLVHFFPHPTVDERAFSYSVGEMPNALTKADLNNDGRLDFIVGSSIPNVDGIQLAIFRADSQANMTAIYIDYPPEVYGRTFNAIALGAGDFDGTGTADLLLSRISLEGTMLIINRTPRAPNFPANAVTNAVFLAEQFSQTSFTARGFPAPTFSSDTPLPAGLSLTPSGVLSGTATQEAVGAYSLVIRASNGVSPDATLNFSLLVRARRPIVASPTLAQVTSTTAILGGDVVDLGTAFITARGIVLAPTAVNPNPTLNGLGVQRFDDPTATTGNFTKIVTGLTPATTYSFAAWAINSNGISYSPVATFQTLAPPGSGSLIVTTAIDEDDGNSDPHVGSGTSLREALAYANALPGDQTITFSPNMLAAGPATIILTRGELTLADASGTTTIQGPGARQLSINGNSATRLFRMDYGSTRFFDLTFEGGLASGNGGVILSYGTLLMQDCILSGNQSRASGGAIYNVGAAVLVRCSLLHNSLLDARGWGGGAIANETDISVTNCTFYGNSGKTRDADGGGGAIVNVHFGSRSFVFSSTVVNNSADQGGALAGRGLLYLVNSIFSGNQAETAPNISGSLYADINNLIDANPNAIFASSSPANNGGPTPTMALRPGGPAVDAGDNFWAGMVPTDQRGFSRILNGVADIGAYELSALPVVASPTVADITQTSAIVGGRVTDDGGGTLRRRGILLAETSINSSPALGGPGVLELDDSQNVLGQFSLDIIDLTPSTSYSFVAFASNEAGTGYSDVAAFETLAPASVTLTWAKPSDITYGTPLGLAQLNATTPVAGSFVYQPSQGTTLSAGDDQTLSVTFTPFDTDHYRPTTATVQINVLRATPTITWPNPADITYGTALTGSHLNGTADVPGMFAYSPPAGTVLAAGNAQTLSVMFTPSDAANYAPVTATAKINVLRATTSLTWANPADINYGTPLGSAQLNATASVAGTFAYTPSAGTVPGAGNNQTLSVTFTPTDAVNHSTATATVTINVLAATPSITWSNPADISSGTPLGSAQLNATASVAGTFVYSPPAGTVLAAGNGQMLSVAFTPADTANYQAATGTVSINVLAEATTIVWSNPADITYGTRLGTPQLNATASVPGSFTYSPPAGTLLNAGNGQVLSVTFTPADLTRYSQATATVAINVRKATPSLNWATPGAITYGTPLNGAQLNARSDVPGTFTYTPAPGVVLPAGSGQRLTASFAPADLTNYDSGSVSVSINVLPAALVITAVNESKTYGAALPTLTVAYAGLVNGDTPANLTTQPIVTTTATASSPVGNYLIIARGAASLNYAISYRQGILTVTRATLSVRADAKNRVYGEANPSLTYIITGLVNGDPASVVSGKPRLSTAATVNSPVGTYGITATVGTLKANNYSFLPVGGTLNVLAASTKTAVSVSLAKGGAGAVLAATVTAVKPSTLAVNEGTVTFVVKSSAGVTLLTTTAAVTKGQASVGVNTAGVPAGTYTITAKYNPAAAKPNFNSSSGSATVTKK